VDEERRKAHIIGDFDSQNDDAPGGESQSSEKEEAAKVPPVSSTSDDLQSLQDKYLRLAAEFENYKRLAQRDQREHSRFANEQLLRELLPVVDNLERAIKSATVSRDRDTLIEGIKLTLKQFLETLGKFGVRPIESVGHPFDPSRHQAVARVPSERAENTVTEEYQKGYLLHERVLRPAMVAVAVGQSGETPSGPRRATEDGTNPFGSDEEPGVEA
jgi:molecular chaperone GrpE